MTATMTRTRPAPSLGSAEAGIPFARLFRVEWTKATDTRSARWLLAISGLATIAIMLAPVLAASKIDQTWSSYLGFSSFALTMFMPIVAIMTMTTEWTQRTVLATFTQEPRRSRVIGAKVAVSVAMSVVASAFGLLVTAGAIAVSSGAGRHIEDSLDAKLVLGMLAIVTANVLMGVAFGGLLHNTAAGIVVFLILPTAFGILGGVISSVAHWIDPGTTFGWMLDGKWGGQHAGGILTCLAIWVVLPLAAGIARTAKREIK